MLRLNPKEPGRSRDFPRSREPCRYDNFSRLRFGNFVAENTDPGPKPDAGILSRAFSHDDVLLISTGVRDMWRNTQTGHSETRRIESTAAIVGIVAPVEHAHVLPASREPTSSFTMLSIGRKSAVHGRVDKAASV